jgi:hypothetical protein
VSYHAPVLPPGRAQQQLYPLSLAQAPVPLAREGGFDLRTLLLLLAAAAVGFWLWQKFFGKKKRVAPNERLFFTTDGPLRGIDRTRKRLEQHAKLMESDGYEGVAKDLSEASAVLAEFTRRTREQTLED